jgi:hypothetical protein
MMSTTGVPAQLFGPPTWRCLFNLFYVAEGNAVKAYPPLIFEPSFKPKPHIQCMWQNLPFVLPCAICRVESAKFILQSDVNSAAVQCNAATRAQPANSRGASFSTLQDFREAVNRRLMTHACVRRVDNCVGKQPIRVVGVFRMRTGCYSMSKLDVVSMCYFIEYNRVKRVQEGKLSEVCPNHCVFLRSLCTLLRAARWITYVPDENMCNFIDAVRELHPPDFVSWTKNMDAIIKEWFTT